MQQVTHAATATASASEPDELFDVYAYAVCGAWWDWERTCKLPFLPVPLEMKAASLLPRSTRLPCTPLHPSTNHIVSSPQLPPTHKHSRSAHFETFVIDKHTSTTIALRAHSRCQQAYHQTCSPYARTARHPPRRSGAATRTAPCCVMRADCS